MLYYLGTTSFRRKIWEFFHKTYLRRVPKSEREPINPEVIERYIGIPIDKYREYIREAATAAGHSWECYTLKWRINIPKRIDAQLLDIQAPTKTNYPEFYYLNHSIEAKQTYLSTLSITNHVLANRIEELILKLVQAFVVNRHKSVKTHAIRLENLLLWMINEQLTEDNRIVVRVCMNKFDMPFTKWSHWGYYRNCSIVLDKELLSRLSLLHENKKTQPEGKGLIIKP